MTVRSTASELCKASGSKCHDQFLAAISSSHWSKTEIEQLPVAKNPMHMAAWKGCIENLRYLAEELSCDLNVISTGEFSYGKTPIFFALTQSREDIVRYLLERKVIVKIVNNKGQSPLSIASSHLSRETVLAVKALEDEQRDLAWQNYRLTHSDGLEYGDLDPRFIDRPLLPTDHVTEFAVNPTTASIRKGNFRRNNPHRAKEAARQSAKSRSSTKQKHRNAGLATDETKQLKETWSRLESVMSSSVSDKGAEFSEALLQIMHLNLKQRKEWLTDTAKRLGQMGSKAQLLDLLQSLRSPSPRVDTLLKRLEHCIQNPDDKPRKPQPSRSKVEVQPESLADPHWQSAFKLVEHLSVDVLHNEGTHLSLSRPPRWVDSIESLRELQTSLPGVQLVSIDTEWCDDEALSTLQIAVDDRAWIINLLCEDASYNDFCKAFISRLFETTAFVLGFAITHDLRKLEDFGSRPLEQNADQGCVLDVQRLFRGSGDLPGLALCVDQLPSSSLPLSKSMQCSDWGQRPLSNDQLAYAGLDAAVLAFMVSEKGRQAHAS